jgi:hypothetical protein
LTRGLAARADAIGIVSPELVDFARGAASLISCPREGIGEICHQLLMSLLQ